MNCIDCKNYCGFLKMDINYVKCNYWKNIDYRASVGTRAIVCPREPIEQDEDRVIFQAIEFFFLFQNSS